MSERQLTGTGGRIGERAARHEQLLEVRGIGPVRARTLDRLFRTTAPSATGGGIRSLAA